ncbi:MAG TPA: CopD family protein, partial [Acetobacteraceae bacterium]|nr:CopD family protein [Acetobacteraceae bacterium]
MMSGGFDLQGGFSLVLARGISVGALLSLFGALIFGAVIAPRAYVAMASDEIAVSQRRLRAVAAVSAAIGLLALLAWLILQSADLAAANSLGATFAAIPTVVAHTFFGHLLCAQLAVLIATALMVALSKNASYAAACVAGIGVLLQTGHSHAYSMYSALSVLLVADAVHLLAAGAWLGGLGPLLLLVRHAPPRAGALAARWFSPLGKWCVGAIVVTAAYQGWVLVASVPGLVGTAYGWMVLVKTILFAVLLGFACMNRYRFAPALRGDAPDAARTTLVRSITLQSCFAIAIVIAAATLSQLQPSMHTQAWWPFAWQFSLSAVREDPDIKREVLGAAAILAGGLALLLMAFFLRRIRWAALVALAAAVVALWLAMPHFDVLLVQAYPTSFYHSPTKFSSVTIVEGGKIFAGNCVPCHGANGEGNGPLAKSLPIPPADLTAAHLWMHSDGELFWWVSHGIENPEGGMAMPGFAPTLDPHQRWAVIDYIRAHNAGVTAHGNFPWPRAVHAPSFTALCDGKPTRLASLSGRWVRLLISTHDALASNSQAASCVSGDPSIAHAYEIVSGLDNTAIADEEFLIDSKGW